MGIEGGREGETEDDRASKMGGDREVNDIEKENAKKPSKSA